MKRSLSPDDSHHLYTQLTEYANTLPVDAVDAFARRCHILLQDIYAKKAAPITVALFREGHEIWLVHILPRIAHLLTYGQLVQLCRVCSLWKADIYSVTHLYIKLDSKYGWHSSVYKDSIFPKFTNLQSIRTHADILLEKVEEFSRVKTLSLYIDQFDEKTPYNEGLSYWTGLTKLVFPNQKCSLKGLETMTQLTSLDIHRKAFDRPEDLGLLINLKELRIRKFYLRHYIVIQTLNQLTMLDTDMFSHFFNYTGEGELHQWDRYDHLLGQTNLFFKDSTTFDAWGTWHDGNFTGHGDLSYDRSDGKLIFYEGSIVNNKMHGHGCETVHPHGPVYEGEFSHNKRHGHGSIYHWPGSTNLGTRVFDYSGRWHEGELVEKDVYIGPLQATVFSSSS